MCMFLLFLSACSEQPVVENQQLVSYVMTPEGEEVQQLSFEVSNDGMDNLEHEVILGESDTAWLIESREKRNELNKFYYENDYQDAEEIRLDMIRSKNWNSVIDGKTQRGYDIILADRGELGIDTPPEPSEKLYNAIVHYGYS